MTVDARIRSIYDAFNDRRIDELLQQMTPDVDWPNAWEGGQAADQQVGHVYTFDQPGLVSRMDVE